MQNTQKIQDSRRTFLKTSSAASMALFFTGTSTQLFAKEKNLLGFKAIPTSTKDTIVVPKGYKAEVLVKWGDALFTDAKEFDEKKQITPSYVQNASKVFGDNTDGMQFYPLSGDDRGLLVVNQEYINPELMFNHNGKKMSKDDVLYEQKSVGVTVVEVKRQKNNSYKIVKNSKYNRRIDALTPMLLTGVVKGCPMVKTSNDTNGEIVLGTFNNCGCGKTPWGTYLSCEENFDDFFGSKDKKLALNDSLKRYGFSTEGSDYDWYKHDDRFDLAKTPNEPYRHGWIIEIDPYDPSSTPKKRTAMGRFKHENADVVVSKNGHVVVYSGDDEINEFVYKFVSKDKFDKNNPKNNVNILEEGTLYVARFNGNFGDFRGDLDWQELSYGKNGLTKENGFNSQSDVLINARLAASIVKATPMDRCEWCAATPDSKAVYATFTNNKKRVDVDAANPRAKNAYGQILKWQPKNGDHTSEKFSWNTFLLAGNPSNQSGLYKGSKNITKDNMFNSPDGLKFDKFGRLWIQTDGSYSNTGSYEGMGNNQMLCANTKTGEIRRFLTGPIACEITGLAFSDDCKTMFVGIQHPGENLKPSHWPQGANATPKSAVVVITKTDGGIIGS